MARGRRSGFGAAAGLFGWGLRKGGGLGLAVVKSPFKLARTAGHDLVAGGGNVLQLFVAIFMWGFFGFLALYLSALLRKTGIVVLAPVSWALIAAGIVFLVSLIIWAKTRGIQSQARLRRALINIEKNTSQAATKDQVEEAIRRGGGGGGGGGDGETFDLFGAFRRQKPQTFDEQVRQEQAQYVADNVTEDIPDWMRKMAGEKVRRWPWRKR